MHIFQPGIGIVWSGTVTAKAPVARTEPSNRAKQAQCRAHGGSGNWPARMGIFARPRQWQKRRRAPYKAPHDRLSQNAGPGQRFRRVRRPRHAPFAMTPAQAQGHRRPPFRHRLRHGGADRARRRRAPTPVCGSSMPMAAKSESCGNATRCVARLLMDERGLARVKLASKGGLLICSDAGKGLVTVDMGAPRLDWRRDSAGRSRWTPPISRWTSGRHAACRPAPSRWAIPIASCSCADAEKAPVTQLGPKIETHALLSQPHQCRIRPGAGPGAASACGCGNAAWASPWPAAPAPAPPPWRPSAGA